MAITLSTAYSANVAGGNLPAASTFTITGITVPADATAALLFMHGGYGTTTGDTLDISNFDADTDDHFTFLDDGWDKASDREIVGAYYLLYGQTGFPTRGATNQTFTGSLTYAPGYSMTFVIVFLSGTVTDGTFVIGSNGTTSTQANPWTSASLGSLGAADLAMIAGTEYAAAVTVTGNSQTELASGLFDQDGWAIGYKVASATMVMTVASGGYQGGVAFAVKAAAGGAVVLTLLTADLEITSNQDSTTASVSPAAGSVLYVAVGATEAGSGTSGTAALSGVMATWTQIASVAFASRRYLWWFRGTGTITNGTITISVTIDGGTRETKYWSVIQATGVDGTTPNDAATTSITTDTGITLSDVGTLGADDKVLAAFCHEDNEAVTLTDQTQLSHTANATGVRTLTVGYGTDDTPSATWATLAGSAAGGFIVNAAAGGAVDSNFIFSRW